ncbi:MAG: Na-Ca exchanger/integrin-beta4 [Bacteroidetes bacterium]|nr:Na-Ca exchanger/integrin-beta4 [Bacteroidota bacterium]
MKKLLRSFKALFVVACFLLPALSNAQFTQLYDFTGNGAFSGGGPVRDQNLVNVGGVMYGMTGNGGLYDYGTLFKINPDGTGYTKVIDFGSPGTGRSPYGSPIYDGTWLYGTTFGGGSGGSGTVFKVKPDGTSYTELHTFTSSDPDGTNPSCALVSDGTYLYGMNAYGGVSGQGSIFKLMPDGTNYATLYNFTGGADGGYPYGSLISIGGFVYGMTSHAGVNDKGVAFQMAKDGSAYTKLLDFDGTNGSAPEGNTFYYDGTFLYGSTPYGGTYNNGVIFKMMPDGSGYSKLFDFQNTLTGNQPPGHFISDGTYLYGTTSQGGAYNYYGTAFRIMPDGTGFTTLYNFDGSAGSIQRSSFISDGTYLYSMSGLGGTNNKGTIYKIMPDGSNYTTLFNFAGNINGDAPHGSLVSDGTYLYGTTYDGGAHNFGVIYRVNPDGTGYTILRDLVFNDGYNPTGSLYYDGTYLYGTTTGGGSNYQGVIFKMMPDGTNYSVAYSFDPATGGMPGSGALISDGTYLYGTTSSGGANGNGTAYKVMTDGSNFVNLHDFDNTNGNQPNGLVSDGTALYGMTYNGGAYNYGIIYKLMPDGTGFTKLQDFDYTTTGGNPGGGLTYNGTFLYGMALQGGVNMAGTIFKIQPDGTGFTVLRALSVADGQYPRACTLLQKGNYMYGMTERGGANYLGMIFKIKDDGTDYSILHSFNYGEGNYPDGSLITDGTSFYGTTYYGGSSTNAGTIFKMCPYAMGTQSPVLCAGQSLTIGSNIYTVSGTYTDTINAIAACDSIVTTNLTLLDAITSTINADMCDGGSATAAGTTYTSGGTYTQVYPAANGCDSTITIHINALAPLDASVTSDGITITLNAGADTYQWVDCNNGNAPIAGATSYNFTPASTGDYAVVITVGSCTATSPCSNITLTGIAELAAKNAVSIYPNPNTGAFMIKANTEGTYVLVNSLGQTLETFRLTAADNYSFKIDNVENGIYFIKNDKGTVQQKVVVTK